MFHATNNPLFLFLARFLPIRRSFLRFHREERVHSLLLALPPRLDQSIDVILHALRIESLRVHQKLHQSLPIHLPKLHLDLLRGRYQRVFKQLASLLIRPVLGHLVFVREVLDHFLDGSVLLDELIRLHLPNSANSIAIIASAQNAQVDKLQFTAVFY